MSDDIKTLTNDAVSFLARNGALDPAAQSIIRGLVDKLREVNGSPKRKKHQLERQQRAAEWFSVTSKNFFGMGVTFEEFMALGMAERFQRSWTEQHPKERKRRLGYITELATEYERICKISISATAWIKSAIEALIEGDLQKLKDQHSIMTEPEYRPRSHVEWKRVIELCEAAIASWPEDGRLEPKESN